MTLQYILYPERTLGILGYHTRVPGDYAQQTPPLSSFPDYEDDRVTIFTCWAFPERTLSKASMDKALRLNILINTREV